MYESLLVHPKPPIQQTRPAHAFYPMPSIEEMYQSQLRKYISIHFFISLRHEDRFLRVDKCGFIGGVVDAGDGIVHPMLWACMIAVLSEDLM